MSHHAVLASPCPDFLEEHHRAPHNRTLIMYSVQLTCVSPQVQFFPVNLNISPCLPHCPEQNIFVGGEHLPKIPRRHWTKTDPCPFLLALPQIDDVLAACTHPSITRALFSATLPAKVEDLAR